VFLYIFSNCNLTIRSDLNRDCRVDLLDFVIFSASWLQCGLPSDDSCGYIDHHLWVSDS